MKTAKKLLLKQDYSLHVLVNLLNVSFFFVLIALGYNVSLIIVDVIGILEMC